MSPTAALASAPCTDPARRLQTIPTRFTVVMAASVPGFQRILDPVLSPVPRRSGVENLEVGVSAAG